MNTGFNKICCQNDEQKIVKIVADSMSFVTEEGLHEIEAAEPIRPPVKVRLEANSLGINLSHEGGGSPHSPILEPFSYVVSIRRVSGNRFLDLTTGYQAIGRQLDPIEIAELSGYQSVRSLVG